MLCFFSLLFRSVFENVHLSLVSQCGALLFLLITQTFSRSLEVNHRGAYKLPFILGAHLANKAERFVLFLEYFSSTVANFVQMALPVCTPLCYQRCAKIQGIK